MNLFISEGYNDIEDIMILRKRTIILSKQPKGFTQTRISTEWITSEFMNVAYALLVWASCGTTAFGAQHRKPRIPPAPPHRFRLGSHYSRLICPTRRPPAPRMDPLRPQNRRSANRKRPANSRRAFPPRCMCRDGRCRSMRQPLQTSVVRVVRKLRRAEAHSGPSRLRQAEARRGPSRRSHSLAAVHVSGGVPEGVRASPCCQWARAALWPALGCPARHRETLCGVLRGCVYTRCNIVIHLVV